MSVVQYFREKYRINLGFSHLPAIQAGTDAKLIYLPMEVLYLLLLFWMKKRVVNADNNLWLKD